MFQYRPQQHAAVNEESSSKDKAAKAALQLPAVPAVQRAEEEPIQTKQAQVAQLKIHVASGEQFDSVNKSIKAPRLKSIAEASKIYLVQSMGDIQKMKQNEDVPVLAPKKHLIGEAHSQSQFPQAAEDWGWGAQLVIEAYSEHEKLKNQAQADKKSNAENKQGGENIMYAKAKGLEDTAVKGLASLVNAQIFQDIVTMARNNQKQEEFEKLTTTEFKKYCKETWQKWKAALGVANSLQTYLQDSDINNNRGIFWSHFKEHDSIEAVLTAKLIKDMEDGLDNIFDQIQQPGVSLLDVGLLCAFLDATEVLIPVVQKLIVSYDPKGFSLNAIERMSDDARIGHGDIDQLNPLRERYMRKNIEAASIPALVKIGAKHVVNLQQAPSANTEGYADYTAFTIKNTANNVEV